MYVMALTTFTILYIDEWKLTFLGSNFSMSVIFFGSWITLSPWFSHTLKNRSSSLERNLIPLYSVQEAPLIFLFPVMIH